jgi:hypothetical protein
VKNAGFASTKQTYTGKRKQKKEFGVIHRGKLGNDNGLLGLWFKCYKGDGLISVEDIWRADGITPTCNTTIDVSACREDKKRYRY